MTSATPRGAPDPHPFIALYDRVIEADERILADGAVEKPIDLATLRADLNNASEAGFDAIFCANMLHIAPWAACPGLMAGARRYLKPGGVLAEVGSASLSAPLVQ